MKETKNQKREKEMADFMTIANIFQNTDDNEEALHRTIKQDLIDLANEGNYEEFAKKMQDDSLCTNFHKEKQAFFENTLRFCKNPLVLVDKIVHLIDPQFAKESFHFTDTSTFLLLPLVDGAMCIDNAELLQWLVEHSCFLEENYQYYLDCVVMEQSYHCIKYLLTLDYKWKITPEIYFLWSQKNLDTPHLDACVDLLVEYFLPQKQKKSQSLDYPKVAFKKLLAMKKYSPSTHRKGSFAEYLMDYYATTPFMAHCITHDLLSEKQLFTLVSALEVAVEKKLCAIFTVEKVLKVYNPRLMESDFFKELSTFSFTHYQGNPDEILNLLFIHHPSLIELDSVRGMVTALALVDDPSEVMVEQVKHLTGEQFEITNYEFPWVYQSIVQNTSLVSEYLCKNWEKVMPKGMKPVISYENIHTDPFFEIFELLELDNLVAWLDHCQVVGEPPPFELSSLGCKLLELPCDHPTFLKALEPDGVLYQEKKHYLDKLREEKSKYFPHYLLSLTLFKEEKSYEL